MFYVFPSLLIAAFACEKAFRLLRFLSVQHLSREPQAVFYRLLRPEFLRILQMNGMPPLSRGALTG